MTESAQARAAVMDKILGLGHDAGLVERYFAALATADLRARAADDLAGAMAAHWQLARAREPGRPNVRVLAPELARHGWQSTTSVVQVVTDDMPFLVDSVTMAVHRCGLAIELVVHPVLRVRRDGSELVALADDPDDDGALPESFIHVEFERVTDDETLRRVEGEVRDALTDVRLAVDDWPAMRARAREVASGLRADGDAAASEIADLVDWMADDHFTFLGAADYEFVPAPDGSPPRLVPRDGSVLGILRSQPDLLALTAARDPGQLLVLTKSERESTVHRPVALDVVSTAVRLDSGGVVGERRLVGLFTSEAYLSSPSTIPVLRRKVAEVIERAGFNPRGHAGKELKAILEGFPRDELFVTPTAELDSTAHGILQLQERRRVRLFARHDANRRVWSCLVYLPRDRYTTDVRVKVQDVLLAAFGGERAEFSASLSASSLARLHYVVHVAPASDVVAERVDVDVVEERVADAVRSWTDDLRGALVAQAGEERGRALHARYATAFPAAFAADVPARAAVADVLHLEQVRGTGRMVISLTRQLDAVPGRARLKLYVPGAPLPLADLLPVLGNLDVRVLDERPSEVRLDDGHAAIQDLGVECGTVDLDDAANAARLGEAFRAVWDGLADDDGFNRLVLGAGLPWPDVAVLRAYARYARQLGFTYSQGYIEATLAEHPSIAAQLVALFQQRFDPVRASDGDTAERALVDGLHRALDGVASLDQDRILRTYVELIGATVRTNAYQRGPDTEDRPALAFKLEPRRITEAPAPRPRFEIFVSSPRVEGVHLRMAPVARGGLRWSERPEDFRTEVLGLMKAQEVKNAVIVPSGAKGGFVVRRPPLERDALMAEVVACYRIFVGSLLDLTDNRVGGGVVPPADTRRHDGDDPYLVVAADKGTATFSDTANAISLERGFWLGDAFASGGSAGYDHKKMGITARGAWESVERHFLRLGNDLTAPFTVAGVGDMSGDVFGNGVLLSEHIALVAAFDHRHVFLDPDPDPATSFAERRRLFDLPRSSWDDYDRSLISAGGGIYARTAKSVPISEPVRRALGLADDVRELTPAQLVSAVLRAPVDLLWNGGIGTYVKASTETHLAAGDRANDAVRVDASELRCKVVGEGGNLGFTQRARVEFALAGGLVNTDAIDNSAGVDTSDHEVNLKILVDGCVADGDLTERQRNELLASITDDVARLVLADNEAQNRILVQSVTMALPMADLHERYIEHLGDVAHLDRRLEALPESEELRRRPADGHGLVAPELAVVLAYTKLHLVEALLAEPGDDPALREQLRGYFPASIVERFGHAIDRHPLRREIAATAVVNDIVNHNGATFVFRMMEETGAPVADVVHAHLAASRIGDAPTFWREVCALDGCVDHAVQVDLLQEADRLVERLSRWLLRNQRRPLDVDASVHAYRADVATIDGMLDELVAGTDAAHVTARRAALVVAGVPDALAARAARMELLPASMDIARLAQAGAGTVDEVAGVYFALDDRLALGELRARIIGLQRDDRWLSLARAALRDDLNGEHAALARTVLNDTRASANGHSPDERVESWLTGRRSEVDTHMRLANDAAASSAPPLATLSVVLRELRTLAGDR